jgi:hypothetical protein
MNTFPDVIYLLFDKFTGLRRGCFALTFVRLCSR